MKQVFIDKQFNTNSREIINHADNVVAQYASQGLDLSLRQLYYRFIATNKIDGNPWFPNSESSYKKLGNIISDARLAGDIDWSAIKDRGRHVDANPHWGNPGEILMSAAQSYRIDTWEGQPNYIIVMVEKDALGGVIGPVCRDLDIEFTANKGYSSSSHMYSIGRKMWVSTY